MKTTLRNLKRIVGEEAARKHALHEDGFLHGVPEWALRQDTTDYVDQIRKRIKQYVLLNKSENSMDQQEAIDAMNLVCDELEKKLYDCLEDALFAFTRRV